MNEKYSDLDFGFDLVHEQTQEIIQEKYAQFTQSLKKVLNNIMGKVLSASSMGKYSTNMEIKGDDVDLLPHIADILIRTGFKCGEKSSPVIRGEEECSIITISWKEKGEFAEYESIIDSLNGRLKALEESKEMRKLNGFDF